MYTRVIPRDLFNESKLLKCIGRLVLLIMDEKNLDCLSYRHNDKAFDIRQHEDDGGLYIRNIRFFVGTKEIFFRSSYNSKHSYPLTCDENYEYVFDDNGEYADEFKELCRELIEKQ